MSGEQESDTGVLVAVRTRPTTSFAHDELVVDPQLGKLTVQPPADHVFSRSTGERATPGGAAQAPSQMFFDFDSVLHNSRQETVYKAVAEEIVDKTTQGVSGAIMAYGQTGSGKTYTMIGDTNNYTNRGIAPRALSQIFDAIDSRPDMEYNVQVSYMEIYNEQIHDLLKAEDVPEPDYVLGEDSTYGVIVKGLSRHTVKSEQEALNALFTGEIHRTTAQHKLNRNSNRSHCIFTIYMDQRSRVGLGEKTIHSKLHLVDLAGSERIKKTMNIPDNEKRPTDTVITKESMFINKSLSYLEQCVLALTRKVQEYVPYRQTRLTNVLKDALSGYCNTAFIGCIWGESSHLEETISTLRLAARMRRVRVHTQQAYSLNPELLARKYEKQIEELKQELAMHNALSERSTIKYDEYSPEEQQELRRKLESYLEAADPEAEESAIQLESVRQMRELLKQMKIVYKEMQTAIQDKARTQQSATEERGAPETGEQGEPAEQRMSEGAHEGFQDGEGGKLDETAGVSVGLADANSRPMRELAGPLKHSSSAAAQINSRTKSREGSPERKANAPTKEAPSHVNMDDPNDAFKWYRSAEGPGHDLAQALISLRSEYRTAKSTAKEAAKQVNEQAKKIKNLQNELKEVADEESKQRAESKEQMADDAEYEKAAELSKAKEEYKRCQRSLKESKDKVNELDESITSKHGQLLQQFDSWYEYHTGFSATGGAVNVPLGATDGGFSESSPLDTSMMFAMGSSAPEGRTSPYRAKASVLASAGSATVSPTGSPSRGRRSPEHRQTGEDVSSTAANLATIGKFSSVGSPGGEGKQGEDALDEGEAFEKMEMERVAADAPDSVAYYQARKRMQSSMREAMSSGQPLHGRRRRQQLASS
eukprot:gb/GECG01004288.1/.p1 GENE.gb/GECG01004288.1/~~gb/GECG01004288.1/.p1  ORF type:complete len:878 (+),score=146.88 gb/GECG01004288.1/:1-2634(+)